jgi:hypothetical protein
VGHVRKTERKEEGGRLHRKQKRKNINGNTK